MHVGVAPSDEDELAHARSTFRSRSGARRRCAQLSVVPARGACEAPRWTGQLGSQRREVCAGLPRGLHVRKCLPSEDVGPAAAAREAPRVARVRTLQAQQEREVLQPAQPRPDRQPVGTIRGGRSHLCQTTVTRSRGHCGSRGQEARAVQRARGPSGRTARPESRPSTSPPHARPCAGASDSVRRRNSRTSSLAHCRVAALQPQTATYSPMCQSRFGPSHSGSDSAMPVHTEARVLILREARQPPQVAARRRISGRQQRTASRRNPSPATVTDVEAR